MDATAAIGTKPRGSAGAPASKALTAVGRLQNIDALRGFVMVLMLVDHIRETWFLHIPVADPVDAHTALPALCFERLAVSLCAPIFVALTGLGVYLFHSKHTLEETTSYLLKRGLVLMGLDLFYLSELYWGITTPTVWLQVIWCIGLCMIILAALIRLPRSAMIMLGLALVCGHNLLDPIRLRPGDTLFPLWAELHQRDAFALPLGLTVKTTYPILPWIGVISLGFALGPWFLPKVSPETRQRRLLILGGGMLIAFLILRFVNIYGDKPWFVVDGDPLRTAMSFISLTKYPASLLFLLLTLGIGAILLALFEKLGNSRAIDMLSLFGGAPMFFYLLHLTVLRLLYHSALAIWGPNHGQYFGVDSFGWVLAWYVGLIIPLYLPTAWFSRFKKRHRDIAVLKYL